MRRNLLAEIARAFLALVALVALVAGLPWALVALVGWPLPHDLPSLAQLREALGGSSISDTVIIKALALVCWVAWAQLVVCTAVEVRAWLQGRIAANLPMAGLLQPVIRQLVMSALLLAGSFRAAPPALASWQPEPVPQVVSAWPHPAPTDQSSVVSPGTAPTAPSASVPPPRKCVVKPRDSLWRLAEAHLGDGMRWRELWELNRGVPQRDGRALRRPELIRPGWLLTFPADASGLDEVLAPAAPAPAAPVPPPTPPAAADEQPPAHAAVVIPPVAPPNSVEDAGPAKTDPPPIPSASAPRDLRSQSETPHHRRNDDLPLPFRIGGGGLLAAGVVATLHRLRRVQQRHRRTGRMIPVPAGKAAEAEASLRASASETAADRLDLALRALAGCLAQRRHGPVPAIDAVSVDGDEMEFLLAATVDAPHGPFEVIGGGRSWTLPAAVDPGALEALAVGMAAPAPALVQIGRTGDREVLIDLEAAARAAVRGSPVAADALMRAIALGLATSTWADDVRLVVIGPAPRGLEGLDRVRVAADLKSVVDDLEVEVWATTKELVGAGRASTIEARVSMSGDPWTPTIVVLMEQGGGEALERLLELAGQAHALAVVGHALPDAMVDRELVIEGETLTARPPGITLTPISEPGDESEAVGEVLELAESRAEGVDTFAIEEPGESGSTMAVEAPVLPLGALPDDDDGGDVVIRVLGPVEIEGGAGPVDRRKSKELVTYLALHPRGVDEGRIKAALWPNEIPSQGSFNQTISRARMCLGTGSDGSNHLPHVEDGLYRLGNSVHTDFQRLEAAYRLAKDEPGSQALEALARALALVRGIPFEGTKGGYNWAHTEGLVARMEAVVADAAHLVAQSALAQGDTGQALWAAAQGLLASPGDEVLFRDRMRAHDAAGNPAGVESVMDELCRVVEALEPYDALHPETIALYEELSRHRRRRTG